MEAACVCVYTCVYSPFYLQVPTHPPTLYSSISCCSFIFPKGDSAMSNSATKISVLTWQILPTLPMGFTCKSWPAEPSVWIQKSILTEGTCYLDSPPLVLHLERKSEFPLVAFGNQVEKNKITSGLKLMSFRKVHTMLRMLYAPTDLYAGVSQKSSGGQGLPLNNCVTLGSHFISPNLSFSTCKTEIIPSISRIICIKYIAN